MHELFSNKFIRAFVAIIDFAFVNISLNFQASHFFH